MRYGIRCVLEKQPGFAIVGETGNRKDAIALCRKQRPDLIIMDTQFRDADGASLARDMMKNCAKTKLVVLSEFCDKNTVCDMFHAGATGYISKEGSSGEFLEGVRTVLEGRLYLSPNVIIALTNKAESAEPADIGRKLASLSKKQKQVADLMLAGFDSKMIGDRLGISLSTVSTHRRNIMKKINVRTTCELMLNLIKHQQQAST